MTGDRQRFPSEREWLNLEPPAIAGDFVDRTLRAVRADLGLEYVDEDPESTPPIPAELLRAYAVEPSGDFVERTLDRIEQQHQDGLHRLLLRYVAPEPSQDFVERTLAALRRDAVRGPGRVLLRRVLAVAAAAAIFLLPVPWPFRRPERAQEIEIAADRGLWASTWSASPWSIARRRARWAENQGALVLAAPDGLFLLQGRAEGGR
ncbi:MAG: hypothetical protein Fur0037_16310 [Planctomycetota bacterium]